MIAVKKSESDAQLSRPLRPVRLPGFVSGVETGMGDVIKRATAAFGIKPCAGCERRAAALNRRFIFTGRSR